MAIMLETILDVLKTTDFEGNIDKITLETLFEDVGLDSLEKMNFFLELEEQLNIRMNDSQFEFIDSFSDLIEFIRKNS